MPAWVIVGAFLVGAAVAQSPVLFLLEGFVVLVLAFVVTLWLGSMVRWAFHAGAVHALRGGSADEDPMDVMAERYPALERRTK